MTTSAAPFQRRALRCSLLCTVVFLSSSRTSLAQLLRAEPATTLTAATTQPYHSVRYNKQARRNTFLFSSPEPPATPEEEQASQNSTTNKTEVLHPGNVSVTVQQAHRLYNNDAVLQSNHASQTQEEQEEKVEQVVTASSGKYLRPLLQVQLPSETTERKYLRSQQQQHRQLNDMYCMDTTMLTSIRAKAVCLVTGKIDPNLIIRGELTDRQKKAKKKAEKEAKKKAKQEAKKKAKLEAEKKEENWDEDKEEDEAKDENWDEDKEEENENWEGMTKKEKKKWIKQQQKEAKENAKEKKENWDEEKEKEENWDEGMTKKEKKKWIKQQQKITKDKLKAAAKARQKIEKQQALQAKQAKLDFKTLFAEQAEEEDNVMDKKKKKKKNKKKNKKSLLRLLQQSTV